MADTPEIIKERLLHWAQYAGITIVVVLLLVGGVSLWRFIFPKPDKQVNRPTSIIVGKAEKGAVDQTSTQVLVTEKPWEVGLGAGALRYDNKDGGFVGGWIKRKF